MSKQVKFPEEGLSSEKILAKMKADRSDDLRWQDGKAFCLIYHPGDEKAKLVKDAYNLFFTENALNPTSFPSLRKYEAEVVSMMIDLLGGNESHTGSMTSGGTESILLAVKTARDFSRKTQAYITSPEIILPTTIHPAFVKACHYFDVKPVWINVSEDYRAIPTEIENNITKNTIMIVASAPSYPHGVIDPIEAIGKIADKHKLLFHVDACIGGMMLPFVKRLGHDIPNYNFEVQGVTSMSADIHKYGYAAKGASVILYNSRALRKHQFSVYTQWQGGVYGSPGISGSKPGGAIAAAWAALNGIGINGYLEMAYRTMATTEFLKSEVSKIKELNIMGTPDMSIFAFDSTEINMYELADELNMKGWHFERLQDPPAIHLTISQVHDKVADDFIKDLKESVEKVKAFKLRKVKDNIQLEVIKRLVRILPDGLLAKIQKQFSGTSSATGDRTAAMYGMMGVISGDDLDEIVLDLLDKLNSLDK